MADMLYDSLDHAEEDMATRLLTEGAWKPRGATCLRSTPRSPRTAACCQPRSAANSVTGAGAGRDGRGRRGWRDEINTAAEAPGRAQQAVRRTPHGPRHPRGAGRHGGEGSGRASRGMSTSVVPTGAKRSGGTFSPLSTAKLKEKGPRLRAARSARDDGNNDAEDDVHPEGRLAQGSRCAARPRVLEIAHRNHVDIEGACEGLSLALLDLPRGRQEGLVRRQSSPPA